ncbi:MAG TPA: UbiD family decarboxylase, partial [Methanoregulaceae archaeon]|nr:UbiD family decarboxylase [Methanoregulaceae archaeon]
MEERAGMRGFIDQMRECGGVIDYENPVAADYEACRLAHGTDRLLFFHDLEGKRGVMNVTATRNALSQALNIPENDLVRRLSLAEFQGNVVCEGNLPMSTPNLQKIPVMKHFPQDAGKYFTAGIVFSRYGDTENASIHRMLVLDEKRVAARLVEGRHTYTLHKMAVERG